MAIGSRKLGFLACSLAGLLLLLSFLLTAPAKSADLLKAEGAWVRLPAVTGRPAGGFLTLHGADVADALVSAESMAADKIELHSVTMEDGVMKMRAEPAFEIPARGKLELKPGAAHLMLFGVSPTVKPGDEMPILLQFRSGATLTVQARTQAAGAAMPGQHHKGGKGRGSKGGHHMMHGGH